METNDALERMRERWERAAAAEERRLQREQARKDRGLGFLLWVLRQEIREGPGRFARRIGTSRSALARWEGGGRQPSLVTLQNAALLCDMEIVIGLKRMDAEPGDYIVLGTIDEEGPLMHLRVWKDYKGGFYNLRPVKWREELERTLSPVRPPSRSRSAP